MSSATRKKRAPRDVATEIRTLERGLSLGNPLSRVERRKVRARAERVPAELIKLVASIAARHDGDIAGISFDADAAIETLAFVATARHDARAARQLARHLEDEAASRLHVAVENTAAVYAALRVLIRTPRGEAFTEDYEDMKAIVRPHARSGKHKPPQVEPSKG